MARDVGSMPVSICVPPWMMRMRLVMLEAGNEQVEVSLTFLHNFSFLRSRGD